MINKNININHVNIKIHKNVSKLEISKQKQKNLYC